MSAKLTLQQINQKKPTNSLLIAIDFTYVSEHIDKRERKVTCKCICGVIKNYDINKVTIGHTKSCGCNGKGRIRNHGKRNHPLYSIWASMIGRCKYPNDKKYHRYGGRGINVCKEWEDNFMAFYEWAIKKWKHGLELDRINNNDNYYPSNCRFVTHRVNLINRSITIYVKYKNKTLTLVDWSKVLNVSYNTIYQRYKNGWSVDKILSTNKLYRDK